MNVFIQNIPKYHVITLPSFRERAKTKFSMCLTVLDRNLLLFAFTVSTQMCPGFLSDQDSIQDSTQFHSVSGFHSPSKQIWLGFHQDSIRSKHIFRIHSVWVDSCATMPIPTAAVSVHLYNVTDLFGCLRAASILNHQVFRDCNAFRSS